MHRSIDYSATQSIKPSNVLTNQTSLPMYRPIKQAFPFIDQSVTQSTNQIFPYIDQSVTQSTNQAFPYINQPTKPSHVSTNHQSINNPSLPVYRSISHSINQPNLLIYRSISYSINQPSHPMYR